MTPALSIYADTPARPSGQLVRRPLADRTAPSPPPTTTSHLRLVVPSAAPVPPLPIAGELSADLEATLLASLRTTATAGETVHALFQRIEAEVGHQLAQLTVIQSRALHQRLVHAAAGDPLATAFHRMVATRKGRLLAFLADARRREAVGHARHR